MHTKLKFQQWTAHTNRYNLCIHTSFSHFYLRIMMFLIYFGVLLFVYCIRK